jgi:flavodoxin
MKSLVIVKSIHHDNTLKIAKAIGKILGAVVKRPEDVKSDEIEDYDLIGFGSGIYYAKLHKAILRLAEKLPKQENKKAFVFSTAGLSSKKKVNKDHKNLREKLESKGYKVIDEFQCKGWDTNSFLKYFGGIGKGRPNAEDTKNAEEFARNLK